MQDRYKYFRVEARDLVDQFSKGLLALERAPASPDLVPPLLRLAHTLKGAARVVKHTEIADHAHAIEDILTPFRDSRAPVPRTAIDESLKRLDTISAGVANLAGPSEADRAVMRSGESVERIQIVRAEVAEMDALLDGVAEAHAHLAAVRTAVDEVDGSRRLASLLAEQLAAPRGDMGSSRAAIEKARMLAADLHGNLHKIERRLVGGAEQLGRELRQVRDAAERLRLVPANILFNALERTARDAAQSVAKNVTFAGSGGDVRLEAHVLDAAQAALVQMVRNAVAHGIEPETERRAVGKPASGRVAVNIVRRRGHAAFICSDDGRGVDLDAVRGAAERRGVPAATIQRLGPTELLRLLLEGGLTTSGTITEVSGRGIGLDVVRESAARLGGEIHVRTEAGKGTTLELVVPLSLSSLDAIVVEAAGQRTAIAVDAVRRTIRVNPGDVVTAASGELTLYDGKPIPLVPLARVLDKRAGARGASRALSALVVEAGSRVAAVLVDRILGVEGIVLRALPGNTPADPVVAGTSIDAQGDPRIVLDPENLVAWAHRIDAAPSPPEDAQRPILIVDDSLTTRMLEQSILESAGYEVDLATSGEEAVEKALQRPYALFLVDVEMPGMDGFTFVERVRNDPRIGNVPAILVTSRAGAEDRRRGEAAGARAYVVKSEFDQTALLETIRQLVA